MQYMSELVHSASEDVLQELRSIPIFRSKVLRYLSMRDQERIARRLTRAALRRGFMEASRLLSGPAGKVAERHGDGRHGRWCPHCSALRLTVFRENAFRCVSCSHATLDHPPEPPKREPVRGYGRHWASISGR